MFQQHPQQGCSAYTLQACVDRGLPGRYPLAFPHSPDGPGAGPRILSIADLATGTAAALGEDVVRELLHAALGLALGDVRDVQLELLADRRPVVVARRVTKGRPIPKA